MLQIQVRPDETIIDALENCMQTRTVRKIWVLTNDTEDAPAIKAALLARDYTVSSGHPSSFAQASYQNTLITSWEAYASDQDSFREILPTLNIVVLDGMSELNMGAWHRWVQKARDAGWYLQRNFVLITV